jgi:O-antigen ligase
VAIASILLLALRPETVLDRFQTWRMACNLWLSQPLFGHGPGASLLLLGENHADSLPLTILIEQGAIGLLAFVWSVVVIIPMFGKPGTPARVALLATLLHQTVDATFYMPGVALLSGAVLGVLVAHQGEAHEIQ